MHNENRIGPVKSFDKVMRDVLDLGKTCESQFKTFTKMTVIICADGKFNLFEIAKDHADESKPMSKGIINIRV